MTTATATRRRRTTSARDRARTARTARTAKTTEPAAQPRYAAEAATVADRLKAADQLGFTRPALRALTGLSDSAVWRAQRGRCHAAEVPTLTGVLDRIESGDVRPPERAAAGHRTRTAQATHVLETAMQEKTLTGTRKLIREALALLNPEETK